MRTQLFIFLICLCVIGPAQSALVTESLDYREGDTQLEGYLVYDDAFTGQRPGIVVVHDWMGPGEYSKKRAQMLAGLGYTALAVDIYGKDVRPKNSDEASQQAGKYKKDRRLLRARAKAGLDLLRNNPTVDPSRIAAIGYCFGGTTVLEMARDGQALAGVVSFHGGLETDMPAQPGDVKAKVLVFQGADDPYVPTLERETFQKEMTEAKADWQMIYYSGAVHSFTHWDAGSDTAKGAAYNAAADRRSWEAMNQFFGEIFQTSQ